MNKKTNWFELKITIGKLGKGTKISLEVGNDGVPSDEFWGSRFKEKDIVKVAEPVKRETMKEKTDKFETKNRGKK